MSDIFFKQLDLPAPDINLEVGSGSHAVQTAQIMTRLEPHIIERKPDLVLVYGDVNSTVAAALVCAKLLVPVGHVEAGLRSRDRTMPEEINRLLTDQLSDLLFTPSLDGNEHLIQEGISEHKIHFVGNVMIDTLIQLLPYADQINNSDLPERYALVTLHRPSNVDEPEMLLNILNTLIEIGHRIPVLFPIHPRTRAKLETLHLQLPQQLRMMEPVGYLEFLALQRKATVVITDSGGIQEETTYLGIPCITVRENTERPVTVTMGTNILVGQDMEKLCQEVNAVLSHERRQAQIPLLWDGKASQRIADIISTL